MSETWTSPKGETWVRLDKEGGYRERFEVDDTVLHEYRDFRFRRVLPFLLYQIFDRNGNECEGAPLEGRFVKIAQAQEAIDQHYFNEEKKKNEEANAKEQKGSKAPARRKRTKDCQGSAVGPDAAAVSNPV